MNDIRRSAIFLDRDGTINEEMGYINHPGRFVLLDGVCEAIKILNENNFLTIVVTNQSGVARGYFPLDLLHKVNERMKALLAEKGARLDAVYFCPHHPDAAIPEYRVKCDCRKPGTGLFRMAMEDFPIELEGSFVIGDRCLDMHFAHACGMPGIMVETGYGRGEMDYILPKSPYRPAVTAKDLRAAVDWIISGRQH